MTQVWNVADTELDVEGEAATEWMRLVQCFAGLPQSPRRQKRVTGALSVALWRNPGPSYDNIQKFLKLPKNGSIWSYMSTLDRRLTAAGIGNRVFTATQIDEIVGGSAARRYGLVNRALKDGTLLRIKRGLYLLSPEITGRRTHPFAIAQALVPGSYVSFESALSYHGWIPEGVFVTASVTPGRKSVACDHPDLGRFVFNPLALNRFHRLAAVARVKLDQRTALVARPLRALMDLVAQRRERWQGLEWVERGLRIGEEIRELDRHDFAELASVYKHKNARDFLASLQAELLGRRSATPVSNAIHEPIA